MSRRMNDVLKNGISFSRKIKEDLEEPDEKIIEEKPKPDPEYLNRQARLEEKLRVAKEINYSGFAVNGGSIIMLLYGVHNIALDPQTVEMVDSTLEVMGITPKYGDIVALIEKWKEHLIACAGSLQLMFMYYQQLRAKMKTMDREDFWGFLNDELGKIGI